MSTRLVKARSRFQQLTHLTAVTSLANDVRDLGESEPLAPPVHPRCAETLRTVHGAPCDEQWREHIRASRVSRRSHSHTCPLGLRCSCVPIFLGGAFVGVAKLVADARTSASDFSAATATLALTVSLSCHESYVSLLRDELQALQRGAHGPGRKSPEYPTPSGVARGERVTVATAGIVQRTLDYLHGHHHEPDLSLRVVAAAVGCNGKYLTNLFTCTVGQRMHAYLVGLRVGRATRNLLNTDRPIKQIAVESGFADAGRLERAFRRHVGVTPSVYRRIFAGH